jgi:hypothetical protein
LIGALELSKTEPQVVESPPGPRYFKKIRSIATWNNVLFSVFIVLSAILLAYSIKTVVKFPKWVVDDAFIIFRYAENLAETGQLTWNPGENPVEG